MKYVTISANTEFNEAPLRDEARAAVKNAIQETKSVFGNAIIRSVTDILAPALVTLLLTVVKQVVESYLNKGRVKAFVILEADVAVLKKYPKLTSTLKGIFNNFVNQAIAELNKQDINIPEEDIAQMKATMLKLLKVNVVKTILKVLGMKKRDA